MGASDDGAHRMIYGALQARQDALAPLRAHAKGMAGWLGPWGLAHPLFDGVRAMRAAAEVFAGFAVTQARPDFGIAPVRVGNRLVEVT